MPAPPAKTAISGTPSRAVANAGFAALWDYVTGLLGATGNAAEARAALGLPNSGPLSGLRNLVINGNFAINQRGAVSGAAVGSANTYTLDRWRVVTSGQSMSWAASGNGNLVTAPAGGIEQVVEGASIAGGTYTLNWTGTATATVNGSAVAKGGTATLTANTNATLRFSSGTVGEVQLEPGSVATPFEARPYGLEEFLCRLYYRRSGGQTIGAAITTTAADVYFSLGQPMRSAPTTTALNSSPNLRVSGSTSVIPGTWSVVSAGPGQVVMQFTRASGTWSAGTPVFANDANDLLQFSSEL